MPGYSFLWSNCYWSSKEETSLKSWGWIWLVFSQFGLTRKTVSVFCTQHFFKIMNIAICWSWSGKIGHQPWSRITAPEGREWLQASHMNRTFIGHEPRQMEVTNLTHENNCSVKYVNNGGKHVHVYFTMDPSALTWWRELPIILYMLGRLVLDRFVV